MADIVGTTGPDSLPGSNSDDTITGNGGTDTIAAADGNDRIIINSLNNFAASIDGGTGTDTLVFRNVPTQPVTKSFFFPDGLPNSSISLLAPATFTSIERLTFESNAGTQLSASFAYGGQNAIVNLTSQIGNGLISPNATIEGGAGQDSVVLLYSFNTGSPYTIASPSFVYDSVNWTTPNRAYQPGDRTFLVNFNSTDNGTVNANSHLGVLYISTGLGNDTVNGSSDMEMIVGGAGNDVLHGNGGDDTLALINGVTRTATTDTATSATGAGTLFDGGSGVDFLALGGYVEFQGTLQSIEGLYLSPGYANARPAPGSPTTTMAQEDTVAIFSSTTFAQLPSNLTVDGEGTVIVAGGAFDGSHIVFDSTADVRFAIGGSEGNDSLIGTSRGDYLIGGDGDDTLTGGGGADVFFVSIGPDFVAEFETDGLNTTPHTLPIDVGGNDVVTDFTRGQDKVSLEQTGIGSLAQLLPFMHQSGADAVIEATFGGVLRSFTLKDTQVSQLTADDFIFASPDDSITATGTESADLILGQAANDTLSGLGGNDTINGQGGTDSISAGDGNDVVVLNAPNPAANSSIDGGTGFDTLVVVSQTGAATSSSYFVPTGAPTTSYSLTAGQFASFERINFLSDPGSVVSLVLLAGGQTVLTGSTFTLPNQAAGITQLAGGNGREGLVLIAPTLAGNSYTFTAPTFTYSNWTTATRAYQANDQVFFIAVGAGNVTLNGSDHVGVQALTTGAGNDTINGSSGMDLLAGGAGLNVMHGGGGDDTLMLNNARQTDANGVAGPPATETGAGSLFDGGDGFDFLLIGGAVNFQGTLQSIEGLYLLPDFTNTGPNVSIQPPAVMTVNGATWAQLPTNLELDGKGQIIVNLAADGSFNGSNYVFDAGSDIHFTLNGAGGNETITGTAGGDTIVGGAGNDIVSGGAGVDGLTGGSGNDVFQDSAAGLNGDTIADFAVGDTIRITDASLAGFAFALNGATLTYTGGSVTLQGLNGAPAGYHLAATAAAGGGVDLTLAASKNLSSDFNGDGRDDILWRSDSGQMSDWLGQANGGFVSNDANAFTPVATDWKIAGTADFNGDGRFDVLWRNTSSGAMSDWLGQANGGFVGNDANAFTSVSTAWKVVGTGDFNGDGRDDILWRNTSTGALSDWLGQANGGFVGNDANALVNGVPLDWQVASTGDFNGDGRDDILWRNTSSGALSDWLGQANGGFVSNDVNAFSTVPTVWKVVGTGDFNGDGREDILWRNTSTGALSDWLGQANGGFVGNDANAFVNGVPLDWQVANTGDYNGDGRSDILWRNTTTGALSDWLGQANGAFVGNDPNAFVNGIPLVWHVQAFDSFAV